MAYTLRTKTAVGYDNIAVGSATGIENIVAGEDPPTDDDRDNIQVGADDGIETNAVGVLNPDPEIP